MGAAYELRFTQGNNWRICTLNSDPGVRALALTPIAVGVLCLFAFLAGGCASVPSTSSAHSPSSAGDPPPSNTPPPPQSATSVTVTPASATLQPGQANSFTATVASDPQGKGVSWALSNCNAGGCGTLSATSSASGTPITYTAPSQMPSNASIVLTATSVAAPVKSASAAISIAATPAPVTVTVSPQTQSLTVNQTQIFTATVQNDTQNKGVTWSLSGGNCKNNGCGTLSATITPSGAGVTYTAPAQIPNPPAISLLATSVADANVSSSASITITATPAQVKVVVSPASQTVPVNSMQAFTAAVQNDPQGKGVTWTLSGAGCAGALCGTVSSTASASGASVTYTAPANAPNPPGVALTATSVADRKSSASANITVFAIPTNLSVVVSPKRGGITTSQTLKFSAVVQNDPTNQGVTWTASSGTFTSVTASSATYHAPSSPGVYIITATSNLDVTKSTTSAIGVTALSGVIEYHNDQTRAGVNSQELALTPSNVNASTFAKLFSCPVDAPVYPQTLWVADLPISGGKHNVIFTATSHNTVYAFDADANPCVTYWSKNLIPSGETWPTALNMGSQDIEPDVGIVGTPVIDPATKILYVVTKTKTVGTNARLAGDCHQRLHALSLIDGSETANGPFELTSAITVAGSGDGSNGTRLPFDPFHENQRPGLALMNNTVYLSWGSHNDQKPWHGWIMGFNKSDLRAAPILFNATPNGEGAGIWMAGGAPSIDSNNNIYVITGNGDYDGTTEFGDSFLKFNLSLALQDWFTPSDEAVLNSSNSDLGSGGAAVLADLPSAPVKHLLIGGGKAGSGQNGELYLINRDAMGHLEGSGPALVQKFPVMRQLYATPAFWNNTLFIAGANGPLNAYALSPTTSLFNPVPVSHSSGLFPEKGATASVSSNGNSHGIVWAVDTSMYGGLSRAGTGPAVLHAYDATNLGRELWNSAQASANRDQAGVAVKFTVPTIANGKVYIGSRSEIDVYGLLPN